MYNLNSNSILWIFGYLNKLVTKSSKKKFVKKYNYHLKTRRAEAEKANKEFIFEVFDLLQNRTKLIIIIKIKK